MRETIRKFEPKARVECVCYFYETKFKTTNNKHFTISREHDIFHVQLTSLHTNVYIFVQSREMQSWTTPSVHAPIFSLLPIADPRLLENAQCCKNLWSKYCYKFLKGDNNIQLRCENLDGGIFHLKKYSDAFFASNHDSSLLLGYIIILADDTGHYHVSSDTSKNASVL